MGWWEEESFVKKKRQEFALGNYLYTTAEKGWGCASEKGPPPFKKKTKEICNDFQREITKKWFFSNRIKSTTVRRKLWISQKVEQGFQLTIERDHHPRPFSSSPDSIVVRRQLHCLRFSITIAFGSTKLTRILMLYIIDSSKNRRERWLSRSRSVRPRPRPHLWFSRSAGITSRLTRIGHR